MFKLESNRFETRERPVERIPVGYFRLLALVLSLAVWTAVVLGLAALA